jgi:hypothetical protein
MKDSGSNIHTYFSISLAVPWGRIHCLWFVIFPQYLTHPAIQIKKENLDLLVS